MTSVSSGTSGSGEPTSFWPATRGIVEPEDGSLARNAPRLQPSAVQLGVLQRDGQPEPGPAGRAGAGRVGAPEAVEDELVLSRFQAYPVVAHRDRDRVAVGGHGDDDVVALPVLDRVDEQVAQDALDPAAVRVGHARLGGQPELDPPTAALRELLRVVGGPPGEIADVERSRRRGWRRSRRAG